MVSNRDFIICRRWKKDTEKNTVTIVTKSIKYSKCPEIEDCVRANTIIQASFLEYKNEKTYITLINQTDPWFFIF
jgi:hypothetical protein